MSRARQHPRTPPVRERNGAMCVLDSQVDQIYMLDTPIRNMDVSSCIMPVQILLSCCQEFGSQPNPPIYAPMTTCNMHAAHRALRSASDM